MDYKITWSPEALDDIDDIAEFHAKKDPLYAQTVVEELITKSRKLAYYPLRGRHVPELGAQDYREIFVYSYRLIYEVTGQAVLIIAAIPGRMPMNVARFD
jgi:addiction module RelE/StbE family toxin